MTEFKEQLAGVGSVQLPPAAAKKSIVRPLVRPLVVLCGAAGAGKSTVARMLLAEADARGLPYVHRRFGGAVRGAVNALFGLSGEQDKSVAVPGAAALTPEKVAAVFPSVSADNAREAVRILQAEPGMTYGRALQLVGTDIGRKLVGENVWVDAFARENADSPAVVDDARFPNEIEYALRWEACVFHIDAGARVPAGADGRDRKHASETSLDLTQFVKINNSGTPLQLARAVGELVAELWGVRPWIYVRHSWLFLFGANRLVAGLRRIVRSDADAKTVTLSGGITCELAGSLPPYVTVWRPLKPLTLANAGVAAGGSVVYAVPELGLDSLGNWQADYVFNDGVQQISEYELLLTEVFSDIEDVLGMPQYSCGTRFTTHNLVSGKLCLAAVGADGTPGPLSYVEVASLDDGDPPAFVSAGTDAAPATKYTVHNWVSTKPTHLSVFTSNPPYCPHEVAVASATIEGAETLWYVQFCSS